MEKNSTKSSEYKAHLGKLLQHKEHSTNAAQEERQQMKSNYRKHNYGKYTLRTHHLCVCWMLSLSQTVMMGKDSYV
jgi:hypothetical protein